MTHEQAEPLRDGLKRVAVALKEAEIPFALTGGYAAWARGGPEPDHDVDFLVPEDLAERAAQELARRGFDVEQPAEDWLFKVRFGTAVVDVLHRTTGSPLAEVLARADEAAVLSVRMPVLAATDVVAEKLLALDEHYCDLAQVLPVVRALREQVDWDTVSARCTDHPFAEAVLFLLERLDVLSSRA